MRQPVDPVAENPPSASSSSRLLLVDDSSESRNLLDQLLTASGHQVTTAAGGEEALGRVAADPFDLVILDVFMPGMDGYEVLTRLNQDTAARHIPVLVLSGYTEVDSVIRCIQLGAEDYLTKPANLLQARVGACLGKKASPGSGNGNLATTDGGEGKFGPTAVAHPSPVDRGAAQTGGNKPSSTASRRLPFSSLTSFDSVTWPHGYPPANSCAP